jgi:membrane-bound serine protease (ClpP class)
MRQNIGSPRRRRWSGTIALAAAALVLTTPLLGSREASSPRAAVVPIHGTIDDVLRRSIERRVDKARQRGANLIIFEMKTPGGLVSSALDISSFIKRLPEQDVRTVAWVNDQAYSAGALISVAAQRIYMASTGSIGDCAPIMVTPTGLEQLGETERAKAESPILAEFEDSATKNGYDPVLLRAMVTLGAEVWWIENLDSGERRFVDGDDKRRLIDDVEQDRREWKLVEQYDSPFSDEPQPLSQPIDADNELLTLNAGKAVPFGLASGIASNVEDLTAQLGLGEMPMMFTISGWDAFVIWLNSPLVRGILFVIMLVGAYMEFQSPGLLVPGITALVALAVFLGAPYAAGLADIWTIVLLILGVILLMVEITVIPGFGIAGVAGLILIAISLIGSFVPNEPGTPPFSLPTLRGTWDAIKTGIIVLASSTIIAIVGIALLAKYLPYAPFANRLVLANPEPALPTVGPESAQDIVLPGDIGVVTGDLRPGGQARFGQHIVDVASQGEYVEAGTRVQVLRHEGMNIVVRPLPDEQA